MAVYLINIFLILFWGYVLLYRIKSEESKKLYCGIIAFQWILISGLRHLSIGSDTYQYYREFERVKNTSWSTILNNIWDYLFNGLEVKDPGYKLVEKTFQVFCENYQIFLLFIALLFTVLMAIWIYKNSSEPCFSFILYSVLFYSFYAVTGHRQTIATALIVFWGYKYIKERKLIKFLIISLVAFLIHKSSVVFIPFYFIANIPITLSYVLIALIVVAAVAISGKSLYGVVADFLGFGEDAIDYAGGGAETYAAMLTLVCIVILLFYIDYKGRVERPSHIFNITLLTLMSSLLVFQNQGFMRIQQYYSVFLMMTFPEVILSFDKRYRILVHLFVITFLVLYLITVNPQYRFFFA